MPGLALIAALAVLAVSRQAQAHVPEGAAGVAIANSEPTGWTFEPYVVVLLGLSLLAYAAGVTRLWRRAGRGRGVSTSAAVHFAGGWAVLAAALTSPVDTLGNHLFWAHMVQHELLMVVAAPLLVLGRPLAVWAWCLGERAKSRLPALLTSAPLARAWTAVTHPLCAWALHALAIWGWHVPALFEASLHHNGIHAVQHACFLFTALLFWWAVLGRPQSRPRAAAGLMSLFSTMTHTAALGAVMSLAPDPWYPTYAQTAPLLGWDALSDQQLGGLLMWVPASVAYLIAAMALGARLLAVTPARRAMSRPARPSPPLP